MKYVSANVLTKGCIMRLLIISAIFFSSLLGSISYAANIHGMDFYFRDSFIRVIDDERGTSIVLDTDTFFIEPGSTVLNPIQYESLDKVAKEIKRHPKRLLSVTGHTDDVYSQEQRYQLSQDYARRIADYLVDAGVNPDRIREVSGEGDLWPIAPNDTAERRHLNRRVEITFLREAPPRVKFKERDDDEDEEEIDIEIEIEEENGKQKWHIEVEEEIETSAGKESVSVIVNENSHKK
jgi:hypothetical protein